MKRLAYFICIILCGCAKNNSIPHVLYGTWVLGSVYNETTAAYITRPITYDSKIKLTLLENKTFTGNTFVNTITDGAYELVDSSRIRINSFSSTKIAEDAWGHIFTLTLESGRMLSSSMVTLPISYKFINDSLYIYSLSRHTLAFKRQ